jgi:hypothetical protein
MGLAEMLLGKENPIAQWTNRNSNMLTGLGTSLLSSGMNFAPMQAGSAMDYEVAERAKADAEKAASDNATVNWLKSAYPEYSSLPVEQGFRLALEAEQAKRAAMGAGGALQPTQDIQEYEYAKANGFTGTFADWMQTGRNGAAGPQLGMTPQWAIDPKTNQYVLGQMSSDGKFSPTEMNGLVPVDPFTLAGGKKGATVDADTAAKARAALPGATVQRDTTLKAIDKLTSNQKGLDEWFSQWGALPRGMYVQGGSEMANWLADFSQAEGQAFLQARQFLKGQGAITELESAKAEQAYSAMTTARQMGDKQKFLEAAADFRAAVEAGYRKLQETAGGSYMSSTPYAPAPAGGGGRQTKTGIPYTVEP